MPHAEIDLDLTRSALVSSTLSHGLRVLGDRWTVAVLLGAFLGVRRFDDWQSSLGIPRHTLTQRLKSLVALGLLRQRPTPTRPVRMAYHLTREGLQLYPHVLMMWVWERRWGKRGVSLPAQLHHKTCGQSMVPQMQCAVCHGKAGLGDMRFSLLINPALAPTGEVHPRATRLTPGGEGQVGLALRVDRWVLMIVSAVMLGCHYFDQLSQVLDIGSSVLARRLTDMVEADLLLCQPDDHDARRKVYRLTPASRDLFGYILCFSSWASRYYLNQPNSIRTVHKACGQPFVPEVVCSHCHQPLLPWDVDFSAAEVARPASHSA